MLEFLGGGIEGGFRDLASLEFVWELGLSVQKSSCFKSLVSRV